MPTCLLVFSLFFTGCIACFWYFLAVQQLHDEHDSAEYTKPVRIHFSAYRSQWWLEFTKPSCWRCSWRRVSAACVYQSAACIAAVSQRPAGTFTRPPAWQRHIQRRRARVPLGRDEFQCAVHARHSQLATQPCEAHGLRGRECAANMADRLFHHSRRCLSDASYAKYTGRQWRRGDWCSRWTRNGLSSVGELQSNSTSLIHVQFVVDIVKVCVCTQALVS